MYTGTIILVPQVKPFPYRGCCVYWWYFLPVTFYRMVSAWYRAPMVGLSIPTMMRGTKVKMRKTSLLCG